MGTDIFKVTSRQISGVKTRAAAEVTDLSRLILTGVLAGEAGSTSLDVDQHIGLAFSAPAGAQGQGAIVVKDAVSGAFVEVSVSLSSGRLVGATLVGRPSGAAQGNAASMPKKRASGLPVFAQHGFAVDDFMPRIEVPAALTIATGPDWAHVYWGATVPDQRVDCGRAFFTFASTVLVGFGAAQLSAAELSALSDSMA